MFSSRKIGSSFNGKILEIPGIHVDNFENPASDGARAYFLSHFHTDHTVGLDKDALKNKLVQEKNIFIYATKLTAAIIIYNNIELKDYVKVLNLGSNLISVPGDGERESETILNVTLIPAGHCLGSTMFLFETTLLRVLYTGDFRIRPNDLSKYAAFHDKDGNIIKIDTLYVDTTFIDTHENFPKRSESIEEALIMIRGVLESDESQYVILDTRANYGYEYVFNRIYEALNMKVYVDDCKWSFYSTIQHLVPSLTNNANETRIFLKHIPEVVKTRVTPKRIRFSAMRWEDWHEDKSSINENGINSYVCFSTHCSRTELTSFVEYLNPETVVGFPKPYKVKCSPFKVDDGERFLLPARKSPKKLSCFKPCRKDRKVDDAVLRKIFG